jgi:2-methylcitrate dehydratase
LDHTAEQLLTFTLALDRRDVPPPAAEAARARLLNCIGVSLAALEAPPVRIVRSLAPDVSSGRSARLFGVLTSTTPEMAAFVNSAMTRFLDMSDTRFMAGVSHPADALPGLIAVTEAEGASGADLLLAIVIAYELQCRFVDVVPISHVGWDQTPVVAMATALACGRLMRMDRKVLGHALSLAITPSIALNQTRTGRISMWKGMAGPQGVRQGVFACYLAAAGMTGPEDIFEGKFGFWKQLFDRTYQLPLPTRLDNHVFAVQQTMIKSFPIRFNCHVPVFAALELREKVAIAEIKTLVIETFKQAFGRWIAVPEVWRPETRETADHSLPFCVAAAMIDGAITPATFEAERYRDPDVLELMGRTEIKLSDAFAAVAPPVRSCRITATLTDGRTVVVEKKLGPEDDLKGMSRADLETKIHNITKPFLDDGARAALIDLIWHVEDLDTVGPLLDHTAVTAPSS